MAAAAHFFVGFHNMPLAWSQLNEIRDYIPVADLRVSLDRAVNALPLIGASPQSMQRFQLKGWYKTGPQQYIHVVDERFRRFAWAASDGAFVYILTDDIFFDDGLASMPPAEVLVDGKSFDWPSVVEAGIVVGKTVRDTDFNSQRQVSFDRYKFYYRHATPSVVEAPICIIIIPKIEPPIEGQQQHSADENQPFTPVGVSASPTAGSHR